MKIKVLGKFHMQGTSKKSGNPYNLNQIHYLGKARGVEGQSAETQFLDARDYPYDQIILGLEYNIEFDNRGYVVGFEPVDRAAWEKAVKAAQNF